MLVDLVVVYVCVYIYIYLKKASKLTVCVCVYIYIYTHKHICEHLCKLMLSMYYGWMCVHVYEYHSTHE